jgi:phage recombination protein Bet
MSTEMVVAEDWTQQQVDLIRRTVCAGATNDELALFLAQARRLGLDPLSRQIHAVRRWDNRAGREVMTIQVGIDGLRLIAQRTGEMDGYDGPYWCGSDGLWRDVWLSAEPPAAARITVYRRGHTHPYTATATLQEYLQRDKNGRPIGLWGKMPATMLAKTAEAMALRRALPADLSGVYEPAELPVETGPVPQAAPAAPAPIPDEDGITPAQMKRIHAMCGERNLDRPTRLMLACEVAGRTISSAHDLTAVEAAALIDRLGRGPAARPAPKPLPPDRLPLPPAPSPNELARLIADADGDLAAICREYNVSMLDDLTDDQRREVATALQEVTLA